MEEDKIKGTIVELSKIPITFPSIRALVDCGLITEQGVRISGNGLIIESLGKIEKLIDRTNNLLAHIEKKIEKLQEITFNKK